MALVSYAKKVTPNTSKKVVYSDFLPNLDISRNDLKVVENEQSVISSIRNILLTNRGERFFNPLLGSDINTMLFENFSDYTSDIVKDMIKVSIKNNEPRAEILDISINSGIDQNYMLISIIFNVINKSEPVTMELILNRIR